MIDVLSGVIAALLTLAGDAARTLTAEALLLGCFAWLAGLLLVLTRPQ